jgi:hypothetical protein
MIDLIDIQQSVNRVNSLYYVLADMNNETKKHMTRLYNSQIMIYI